MEKRKQEGLASEEVKSDAIKLFVNNIHSIPVGFSTFFYVDLHDLFDTVDCTSGATTSGTAVLSFPIPGRPCAYRCSACIWLCGSAGS